ncbi:MAG: hypothetical protein ACOYJ2_01445 [Rickettsiales bacterium]
MVHILTLLLILAAGTATAQVCSQDSRVIAPCREVRARLLVYANLRPYLEPIKTQESFSVALQSESNEAAYFWPKNIPELLTAENVLQGDFRICPMDVGVCIDRASNLSVE